MVFLMKASLREMAQLLFGKKTTYMGSIIDQEAKIVKMKNIKFTYFNFFILHKFLLELI